MIFFIKRNIFVLSLLGFKMFLNGEFLNNFLTMTDCSVVTSKILRFRDSYMVTFPKSIDFLSWKLGSPPRICKYRMSE